MARGVASYGLLAVVLTAASCTFGVEALPPLDLAVGANPDFATSASEDLSNLPSPDLTGVIVDLKTSTPADMATLPADMLMTPADMAALPAQLAGARAAHGSTITLSTEGTSDWAHFGMGAAGTVNRKAGITPLISMTSNASLQPWGFFTNDYSWTGGTPTASATTNDGTYLNAQGNTYTVVVPADNTLRTLRLYVVSYRGSCTLNAHLSDSSAADYNDTLTDNNNAAYAQYTITYRAASAAKTLTVTWSLTADAGGGTVDLMAATLF